MLGSALQHQHWRHTSITTVVFQPVQTLDDIFDVPIVNICRCDYQLWKKMPDFWEKLDAAAAATKRCTRNFLSCQMAAPYFLFHFLPYLLMTTFWMMILEALSIFEGIPLLNSLPFVNNIAKSENSAACCVSHIFLPSHHLHHHFIIHEQTYMRNYISTRTSFCSWLLTGHSIINFVQKRSRLSSLSYLHNSS